MLSPEWIIKGIVKRGFDVLGSMKRILVIDDEDAARRVLTRALKMYGYEVLEADDGVKGMRQCRETLPDAVITDIFMPEQDGLETITAMRAQWPEIKIIAVSGGGNMGHLDILHAARAMGASKVLTKPFDLAEMKAVLEDVVGAPDS